MEDFDENDFEVIDAFQSGDEEPQSSKPNSNIFEQRIMRFKETSDEYYIYDKCSKVRIESPEPTGNGKKRKEEKWIVKGWTKRINAMAKSPEIKLSLAVCQELLERHKRTNGYKVIAKQIPPNHYLWEKVPNPVPREGISGFEWHTLFEGWKKDMCKLRNSPEFKIFQLAQCNTKKLPAWIKQPTKDLFDKESDFAIAIDFYTKLVTEPQKYTLDGQIPDLDYRDLVKYYEERKKKWNYNKIQRGHAVFLWCTQERWAQYYQENLVDVKQSNKLGYVIKEVEKFKRSVTYEKCPPEKRPQTPTFEPMDNPVAAKGVMNEWKVAISHEVPRQFRPAFIVRDDDIKEVMESKLYKEYCDLRHGNRVKEIRPYKNIKSVEQWDREMNVWKKEMAAEIKKIGKSVKCELTDRETQILEAHRNEVKNFKKKYCYQTCPDRPPTPDIENISMGQIEAKLKEWKVGIYKSFPRTDRPLAFVKDEDLANFKKSEIGKKYETLLTKSKHVQIETVVLNRSQHTLEEWDKEFARYVNEVEATCKDVNVEEYPPPAKKPKVDSFHTKNRFRYRLADFTHCPVYQKSKKRPPTPKFDDYEDPQQAIKALDDWMNGMLRKFTREDWPLFYVKEKDLADLHKSQLFKNYQKALQENIITKIPISFEGDLGGFVQSTREWDKYLDTFVAKLKESVEMANNIWQKQKNIQLQLPQPAQLSSNGILDLPLPQPSGSSATVLPKPSGSSTISLPKPSGSSATILPKPSGSSALSLPKPLGKARAPDDLRSVPMDIESVGNDEIKTESPVIDLDLVKTESPDIDLSVFDTESPGIKLDLAKTESSDNAIDLALLKTESPGIDLVFLKTLDPEKDLIKYVQAKSLHYSNLVDKKEANCRGFIGSLVGACVRYVPCGIFNQSKCGEGFVHVDKNQEKRIHSCALCYYALCGMITMHPLFKCPLLQYQ